MLGKLKTSSQNSSLSSIDSILIRLLDLAISVSGLFILAPLFLGISLVIKFTSAGPVFYRAIRVGQGGKLFALYKFRTMVSNASRNGPGITINNDPRITSVGRFLRRTKLDELPQLFNVLRGEMSLVGPRPEDPRYVALYTPEQRQVLSVRPGITSAASLRYSAEETLLSGENWETIYTQQLLPHKLALDIAYLKSRTVWTDMELIWKTATTIATNGRVLSQVLQLRNRHLLLLDILTILVIPALAVTLRVETLSWRFLASQAVLLFAIVALLVKIPVFYYFGLYKRYWRYAGVNDLNRVVVAVGWSTLALTFLFFVLHPVLEPYNFAIYRSVPVIDGILTFLAVGGFRFGLRGLNHWHRRYANITDGERVLIVGAGEAGILLVREIQANPQLKLKPIAFVDDDLSKSGAQIQGLAVTGSTRDIPKLVAQLQIQRIIVAMPSIPFQKRQEIVSICRQTGVATFNLPGIYEFLAGHKTISRVPEININDLLQRNPIETNQMAAAHSLKGVKVLVTGAGGSIGSELCRQIAQFDPAEIILLGHGENSIFEINLKLRLSFPNLTTHPVIVNIRDQHLVNWVMREYQPDVVFHAAAHKHVPFMEATAGEAIINNVLGTKNVIQAAEQNGVERFVLISTDKAVNPTSIMGATKRLAELMVLAAAQRSGRNYTAVRFGNVLGSRGSVVPVFQRQIAAGGPVTITHPEMTRYFMTIPEAVQLVLQASVLGRGGEIFVLDMGQPVRIMDLATNLIRLSGLKPYSDIEIVFSGIRPGEKLHEQLFLTNEDYRHTRHPKIFVATYKDDINSETLEGIIVELINFTERLQTETSNEELRTLISKICYYIDQYNPKLSSHTPISEMAPPNHIISYMKPLIVPLFETTK